MRIAIVDDRLEDRAELIFMLSQYAAKNQLSVEYQAFSCAEELLKDFKCGDFQIVFLDIYMGGMTGMEAAQKLFISDLSCHLIFVTASHAHAVQSYEVRATYYLTKPLVYEQVCNAMNKACAALVFDNRNIILHCKGIACEILLSDLMFVDCAAEHTRLHLIKRIIVVDERACEVFSMLEKENRFLLCNRNVSVNMEHIARVNESDFLLDDGELVPIKQHGRNAVKQEFLQYSLKSLRRENTI